MGYTWAQFTAYLRLARSREAARRANDLVIANQAYAGGDAAKRLLQDLHRQAQSDTPDDAGS